MSDIVDFWNGFGMGGRRKKGEGREGKELSIVCTEGSCVAAVSLVCVRRLSISLSSSIHVRLHTAFNCVVYSSTHTL